MASVTFDTKCADSEISLIFPYSHYFQFMPNPISKEDSIIGGPETRYLFKIFALSLNL